MNDMNDMNYTNDDILVCIVLMNLSIHLSQR